MNSYYAECWADTSEAAKLAARAVRIEEGIRKARKNKEDPRKIANSEIELLLVQDDIARLQKGGADLLALP